ncbi:MAG: transposase [Gammaproteobacteria bacterium]|nr:transposase [Gammaproteobacteria bacterium]
MPRIARIVVPDYPHHVTQRGARRQRTFFEESDYRSYLNLLSNNKSRAEADIWAYCLMPNHVHLVVVPHRPDSLSKLLGNTHHRYARLVNEAHGWQGHLWQERFQSFVMDEEHLVAAVRYIELNPVRAGLCHDATEWRWSSIHAHLQNRSDPIVTARPMLERVSNWRQYLADETNPKLLENLRKHTNSGRPAGSAEFVNNLENLTQQRLRPRKRGPQPKS